MPVQLEFTAPVFRLVFAASAVFFHPPGVGKFLVGIFVEHLKVGMRGRGIQVIVEFLDVLSMVAFAVGKPEQALLGNRVATVPQRRCRAKPLAVVTDPRKPVLVAARGESLHDAAKIFHASPHSNIELALYPAVVFAVK